MPYLANCLDCEWEQGTLNREQADHAKRVHEVESNHDVTIQELDE